MADLTKEEIESLSDCVGIVQSRISPTWEFFGSINIANTVKRAAAALEKLERPSGDEMPKMFSFTTTTHVEVRLPVKEGETEESMRAYVEALVSQGVGELEDVVRNKERGELGRIEIKVKEGKPWQS